MVLGFMILTSASSLHAQITDSGNWVNKQYKINGGWEIDSNGDRTIIRFTGDFSTKKGPDLKIFLSKNSINDVTGKTATDNAIKIAALKTNKGAQEYLLPEGIKLDEFQSLLIHCEQYSVLWGGTDFKS